MTDQERRFREWLSELRQAIMNLPLASHAPGYCFGHRDARHAAAELVSEFAAKAKIFGQEDEGPHVDKNQGSGKIAGPGAETPDP